LLGQLLFALEQLLQVQLVEVLELLGESAAVLHPLADGFFQGAGDVQQSPSAVGAGSQIQGPVQLALPAAAGRFAAGAGAFDQRAAQEGLLADQLGESGTGVAFRGGAVRAVAHGVSSSALTQHYTLRASCADTPANECEFAPPRANHAKVRTDRQLSIDRLQTCGAAAEGGGHPSLLVDEELARAICNESAAALIH
jgi:hypothetical protein